jgi:hypothetical protein
MEQGKLKIVNTAALLVLILLCGTVLIVGFERSNSTRETAFVHFTSLWDSAERLFQEGEVSKNRVFQDLRQDLREMRLLRSFVLYDDTERIYYVYGRTSGDVHFATSGDEKYRSTVTLTKDSPFDISLSRSSGKDFTAEAVYTTLSRKEVFSITQLFLLGLVLVAIVLVIFIAVTSRDEKRAEVIYAGTPPTQGSSAEEAAADLETETEALATAAETAARSTGVQAAAAAGEQQTGPSPAASFTRSTTAEETQEEGLYSEFSGFCRKMFLRPRLESELKRAAAFDQDLVLSFVRCLDEANEHVEGATDGGSRELHERAMSFFPFQDLLFEFDGNTFAVILPNTDLDQGIELLTKFQHHLFETEGCCQFETAVGLSSRNGRLIDHDRIITETNAALEKAVEDPETKLIGFRPDPGKYRSFVAKGN